MHFSTSLGAMAAAASTASAGAVAGFNYGNMFTDKSSKFEADFEREFKAAKALSAPTDFTSARLYTCIQAYSKDDIIEAIPAAVKTDTSILFGLWASGGDEGFNNELSALKKIIDQYGSDVKCDGISVGSEDLYRVSVTGIANESGVGAGPETLTKYIKEVRKTIKGTAFEKCPIGHVDTWNAWVNGTNSAVIEDVDWCGFDEYSYWQNTDANAVENSKPLFDEAYDKTKQACGSKPIWVTETGWPVRGKDSGDATASVENAKTYWDEVGCPLFGDIPTWWYIPREDIPKPANPDFSVLGDDWKPLFDMSCQDAGKSSDDDSKTSTGSSDTKTQASTGSSDTKTTGSSDSKTTGSSDSKTTATAEATTDAKTSAATTVASTVSSAAATQTSGSSSGSGSGSDSDSGDDSSSGSDSDNSGSGSGSDSGSDDSGKGSDNSGEGSDNSGEGSDNSGEGSDNSGEGSDNSGSGSGSSTTTDGAATTSTTTIPTAAGVVVKSGSIGAAAVAVLAAGLVL